MFGVDDLLGAGMKVVSSIIDRVWPDPVEQEKAKMELLRMQQTGELAELQASTQVALAQIGVNNTEAANPSLFVAGWRPAIGWVGAGSMAYMIVCYPILKAYIPEMAPIDITLVMTIIGGMLGINGVSRSVEKAKGVATSIIGVK